jgi:hypothetical protein
MEVVEADAKLFGEIIAAPHFAFGGADFATLNRDKAEEVYYLLFTDSKYRLGITLGKKGQMLKSPFSAPFGGFVYLRDDVKIYQIEAAVDALLQWMAQKGFNELQITLPPSLYAPDFLAKQMNVLFRKRFSIQQIDLNYAFASRTLDEHYMQKTWRNARKNLKKALAQDLNFFQCKTEAEKQKAYEVIAQNREQRGFPLRMSWNQVKETTKVIPADFFRVEASEGTAIAAALVFKVAADVVQVIYWGDLPDYSELKTMNFLSYKLFSFYKEKGIQMIDIGPSTEDSVPNHGLCEFKESIGCNIQPKYNLVYNTL